MMVNFQVQPDPTVWRDTDSAGWGLGDIVLAWWPVLCMNSVKEFTVNSHCSSDG